MPTTSFSELDHRVPVAQARVNMPAPAPDSLARTVKDDGSLYHPLTAPGGYSGGYSPPADPIPTEEQLRHRLVEALEIEAQCADLLTAAQSANDRAQQHLERNTAELHGFDGLDDAISRSLIEQLSDGNKARVEIGADLDDCIADRERARTAHAAAIRAAEHLACDLTETKGKAAEAAASVERLLCNILSHEASRIADQHAALLAEAAKVKDVLHAFDHFSSNKRVSLSPKVRAVLGSDISTLARQRDQTAWRAAAAKLRADPAAIVEIV